MTPLLQEIVDRIHSSGPLPFAAFMAHALYHPKYGYYASGQTRTGRTGHFLTSAELDPSYGSLWAGGIEDLWDACGRPPHFEVVEIGPGEGGFATSLLSSVTDDFADALHLTLVERVPAVAARQRERFGTEDAIKWVSSVTEVPSFANGVVIANEVLDNLPVHLVHMKDGRLREICIAESRGRLILEDLPPSSPELARYLERAGVELPEGHRFEIGLAAESLVKHVSKALGRGALVFVDYGAHASDLAQKPRGTLVSYSAAGVDEEILTDPGERDITSHANWTAVANACGDAGLDVWGPRSQREVMLDLGARELATSLRAARDAAIGAGEGGRAVRALSRGQALNALLDPGGLGGLGVLVAGAGIPAPRWIGASRC